ncbi:hypothetical protein [uncultured Chryseobacterium sp.]|uniref:hypothetical protein n=1 Tax=uncultured Chryseobacterium sp. TaxID=259322 RepID=UPI0025FC5D80|nr:hypothetical protein [uncultured Chryseobacterium sp.]
MKTLNNFVTKIIGIITISFALAIGYIIIRLNYGIETGTKQRTTQIRNQEKIKEGVDRINAKIDRKIIDSLKHKIE